MQTSAEALYLDSSALVKLVLREPEAAALFELVLAGPRPLMSSALARTEVVRAVAPQGPAAIGRATILLSDLHLIGMDDVILDRAAGLPPPTLRSLDAIHLAAAIAVRDQLAALITYDRRLGDAAREAGFKVEAPA